jgi:hypothetical protein
LGNIKIFLLLKSNFPHTKFDFLQRLSAFFNGFLLSAMPFCFPQCLSAFRNGFPIFLNGCLIFLNGFCLSKKSKKIYLRRQVYKRSPFELRISRHSLPELHNCHSLPKLCNCHSLPELCNCHLLHELRNCYNAYISPNTLLWCTCVPNSAPNLKSKLKYNLSRI